MDSTRCACSAVVDDSGLSLRVRPAECWCSFRTSPGVSFASRTFPMAGTMCRFTAERYPARVFGAIFFGAMVSSHVVVHCSTVVVAEGAVPCAATFAFSSVSLRCAVANDLLDTVLRRLFPSGVHPTSTVPTHMPSDSRL